MESPASAPSRNFIVVGVWCSDERIQLTDADCKSATESKELSPFLFGKLIFSCLILRLSEKLNSKRTAHNF